MGMIRSVGLVLHPARDCAPVMRLICDWALRREVRVLGLPGEIDRIGENITEVPQDDLAGRTDLIVSLGGDGTMLRAMRLSSANHTPVLGVNMGRLGFLAEIDRISRTSSPTGLPKRCSAIRSRLASRCRAPRSRPMAVTSSLASTCRPTRC